MWNPPLSTCWRDFSYSTVLSVHSSQGFGIQLCGSLFLDTWSIYLCICCYASAIFSFSLICSLYEISSFFFLHNCSEQTLQCGRSSMCERLEIHFLFLIFEEKISDHLSFMTHQLILKDIPFLHKLLRHLIVQETLNFVNAFCHLLKSYYFYPSFVQYHMQYLMICICLGILGSCIQVLSGLSLQVLYLIFASMFTYSIG